MGLIKRIGEKIVNGACWVTSVVLLIGVLCVVAVTYTWEWGVYLTGEK